MVATSFLLDSHLAERTRLGGPLDLEQVLLGRFVLIGSLLKLRAAHTFMPFDLVSEADSGLASTARHKRALGNLVNLSVVAFWRRAPNPV